jgi:hypothetical protein
MSDAAERLAQALRDLIDSGAAGNRTRRIAALNWENSRELLFVRPDPT